MALTRIGSIGINTDITLGGISTFSADGVDITGVVTATTFSGAFSGDGSALTGVANTDVIFPDKISLGDGTETSGDQINIGVGSDLKLYHTGSHSYIANVGTGELVIEAKSGENGAVFRTDGASELYYDGTKKLETASGGVTVTGTVAATSYTGDGSALTGLAVGISTEAASISGITTYLDLTKDDHELVVTGNNTISVIGGPQGTSHSLRIQNSGIATVTLDSTYFKFPSGAAPALPTASGAISMISFTVHKAGAVGVNTILLAGASVSFS